MKSLYQTILLALAIFLGVSCNKNEVLPAGEISLSFEVTAGTELKTTDAQPKAIVISIKNADGETVINMEKYELIKMGSEYMTQHIELNVGSYIITDFMVIDANDSAIYLTPKAGSEFAKYVSTPLPYEFVVEQHEVTKTVLDVLPTNMGDACQYGYATFAFNIIKIIEIQPDSITGKDAFVHSYHPDLNYGAYPILQSLCWTIYGSNTVLRSFIQFDLSLVGSDEEIVFATLSLYEHHLPENPTEGHTHLTNSSASYISRVTEEWVESTITWNNQPAASANNRVFIPQDTNAFQDYVNIDVTALVNDIRTSGDGNHGFMISLVDESPYCALYFASSDYEYRHKRPKLTLYVK